jgi:hypothetical protein
MIQECLQAAGIDRVIWIDDLFSTPTVDDLVPLILKGIKTLKVRGDKNINLGDFGDFVLEQDDGSVEDAVYERVQASTDEIIRQAAVKLEEILGAALAPKHKVEDLSPEDFKALQDAFGETLRPFSLKTWTAEGAAGVEAIAENTLCLIDLQFNRENATFDGILILRDLLERSKAYCIVLTHKCKEDGQDTERDEISAKLKVSPFLFSVLSKQQGGKDGAPGRFARALGTAMTSRFTGQLAAKIQKVIVAAADKAATDLTRQATANLEKVLFDAARKEGVPECEVALRIFSIEQRYMLNEMIRESDFQGLLRRTRKFRRETAQVRQKWHIKPDISAFQEWRKREVFEKGDGLNALHAPLACGDVFKLDGADELLWVLVAQPCNLLVRGNGVRKAGFAVLAPVEKGEFKKAKKATEEEDEDGIVDPRYFDVTGVFGDGAPRRVDFREAVAVDLSVLDFAVFNPEGRVRFERVQALPEISMLEGWEIRFDKAKARIFPTPDSCVMAPLVMGHSAESFKGGADENSVWYPISRYGRLERTLADAIHNGC